MQIHNPHSHSLLCHPLGETLDPFETRELAADHAKLAGACEDCGCVVTQRDEKPKKRAE